MIADTTKERRQRSPIVRELVPMDGAYIPRMRAKPLLTPMAVRQAILDELDGQPEDFRLRSIRRRLTRLDRALTDTDAAVLDRALNAWLSAHQGARAVNLDSQGIRSTSGDKAPITGRQLYELGAYQEAIKHLSPIQRKALNGLFALLSPFAEAPQGELSAEIIGQIRWLARDLKKAYRQ